MSTSLSLLREILAHHTDEHDEQEVLTLVAGLDAGELDDLLTQQEADRLVSSVDDHLLGPKNRQRLLELLVHERVGELGLEARAALVYALQTGRTGSGDEALVAELLCGAHGAELTRLKNIINLRTDHHDLEGLVFVDIDSPRVRQQVLDHIRAEAALVTEQVAEAKVLSDIDDTVFCRLHDRRYPKGTLYPGVLAFQEALDQGPDDDPMSIGDLTFVTARPADFFGLVENHSRASLRKAGVADLSVMSGSLFSLFTKDAMAGKKVENVSHYIELFPEYRMTFMGDSGQGDVRVGERLWELYPDVMEAVFIHDVVDTAAAERDEHARHKIWFHDTYVGAATKALELTLISRDGWQKVADEASQAMAAISWDDEAQGRRMHELLRRDLAAGA